MNLAKAALLGIIEGITEFIPISSTGHLILVEHVLAFTEGNTGTFSIAIQLGAILAVVFHFPLYFKGLLLNWKSRQMKLLIVAVLPAFVSGFFLYSLIKTHLFSPTTVLIALFLGGIIMIWVEKALQPKPHTFDIEDITYRQSFIIGLSQCCALWPGMSRSGSTIVGGLVAKLDHQTAAKFSFLIAVPVMVAAVGYDMIKSFSGLTVVDFQLISVGLVVSFIVAYFSISTFLKALKRWHLFPFACYRILLSVIIFLSL